MNQGLFIVAMSISILGMVISTVVLLLIKTSAVRTTLTRLRLAIIAGVVYTSWIWLPWLFYAISFIPFPSLLPVVK